MSPSADSAGRHSKEDPAVERDGGAAPALARGHEERTDAALTVPAHRFPRLDTARVAVVALLLLAVWAGVLYEPWKGRPIAVGDFSEFLPFLRHGRGFADTLSRFVRYYGRNGRFNVLGYAAVIAKWELFHANTVLWHLARSAQMLAIVVGTFALLRRLSVSTISAALSVGLLLVGTGAAASWTRLTAGEPLVVLFLLCAAHCAVRFQAARRWLPLAVAVALCCAAVLLSKEALVVTVPFVLGLALCFRRPGDWAWPSPWRRRDRTVVVLTCVALTLAMLPVAFALRNAAAGGYTSNYGSSRVDLPALARLTMAMFLPIHLTSEIPNGLRGVSLVVDVLFALVTVVGWTSLFKRWGRRVVLPFLAAVSLPAALVCVYLPWPGILAVYLLPAVLGQAALVALALDGVRSALPGLWPFAVEAMVICLLGASAVGQYDARQVAAGGAVNAEVVAAVRRIAPRQPMVVAQPDSQLPKPPNQWVGRGPTLQRHVRALFDEDVHPVTDAGCSLLPALRRQRIPVIVYAPDCGVVAGRSLTFRRYFSYIDAQHFRVARDSVRADILLPSGATE